MRFTKGERMKKLLVAHSFLSFSALADISVSASFSPTQDRSLQNGQHYVKYWAQVIFALLLSFAPDANAAETDPPSTTTASATPLISVGNAVDWWFVFKFNAKAFPGCAGGEAPSCKFGGSQTSKPTSLQYVFASNQNHTLKMGKGCLGNTDVDPVGATYASIYSGNYYYVVWNDQFYQDPHIQSCGNACAGPWGHSKGIVAWNDAGDGLVLQVSTPSWPGSGSIHAARTSDNTLGCIAEPDNVMVSQSFFSLKLNRFDVLQVLKALANASVATDIGDLQVVRTGGPPELQTAVLALDKNPNKVQEVQRVQLSSDVGLLVKPSALAVPPWQFVSAELGQVPLRVASWWTNPEAIGSTTATTVIDCWSDGLPKPGPVEIATSGDWNGTTLGLKGTASPGGNHAKVGVSKDKSRPFVILGDMNQEGPLTGTGCTSHQDGRGGLFFIISDQSLWESVSGLLKGESAPLAQ